MRLSAYFIASLICASAAVHAENIHMDILFSGSPAGENDYQSNPDGTFTSKTKLNVGSVSIQSTMTGKIVSGRLTEYRAVQISPGGDKTTIIFYHGKLSVQKGDGKAIDLPTKVGSEPYFGNLHPQISRSALKAVDFGNKSTQTLKVFCPDVGSMMTTKFTPLDQKSTTHGSARMFNMSLAPVEVTYGLDDADEVVLMDVPGQKLRFIVPEWGSLVKDPLAAFPELSQPTYKFVLEKGIKMKTRDGATLVADVIRPDAPGKFPVVLERTPYGRASSAVEGGFYASRGYVFVAQDCRGRGDSNGEWDPFIHERKDGYDAVQWVAKEPWSDGNVGMIGGSYGGFVQWAAAVENPPALKCIVPQVSPPDAMLNLPYDNGVFYLYGAVWWAKIVSVRTADLSSYMSKLPNPEKFTTLPLGKIDKAVLGQSSPFFKQWLAREKKGDWTGFNYEDDLKNVKIPALHISGWWDGDEIGTMLNWARMRDLGRTNQWLVYGPWTHAFNSSTKIGDADFGPDAMIDLDSVYLRWFDTWLKHKSVGMEKLPHVRAFVTGSNKWVESSDWPLKQSKPMRLYLSATGTVEGADSTGMLATEPPAAQKPSKYKYDPHAATIDKRLLNPDPNNATMKVKLPKVAPGVVLFRSEPMKQARSIAGPIVLDLRFSTSAQNTDFYANLIDIDEKGDARAMGQAGRVRCSYMNGLDKQVALKPGKIYSVKIRLWDTAHQFAVGHRIGLLMSSTQFPLYARNLGTIDPIATATRMVVQNQKLFHDKKNPSSLTFQVLQ